MTLVEALRIDTVQLPHAQRQVALWRLDQQMIVIVHQTVGVAEPTEARHHFAKTAQKQRPILIIKKDRIPRIAARSDVIDCTGKLKTKWASHKYKITWLKLLC